MTRFTAALAIFAILYCAASVALDRQIDLKKEQVRLAKADSDKQIERIQSDIENTKEKANTYATLIKNLEDSSNAQAENNRNKNMIPTFLTQLMGNHDKETFRNYFNRCALRTNLFLND